MRPDAPVPRVEHFPFGGEQAERRTFRWRAAGQRINDAQHVLSCQRLGMAVVNEIAFPGDSEIARRNVEFLRREQFRQFLVRPAIELPLVAFAVGVLGGIKSAVRMRHVAQDVIENVAGGVGVIRFLRRAAHSRFPLNFGFGISDFGFGNQVGIEIELRELRLVVEHLLEMRHEPFGVHRVTREPAAQLVVNAAGGHAVAGVQHHARGFLVVKTFRAAQQQRWQAGLRKFGRAAETAVARVEHPLEKFTRVFERIPRQTARLPRPRSCVAASSRAWMSAAEPAISPRRFARLRGFAGAIAESPDGHGDCPAGNKCRRKTV